MRKTLPRAWLGAAGSLLIATLATVTLASTAQATTPTLVTCAGLQGAVGTAAAGEVLQLPAGVCDADLSITNTAAFTLEGASGGGTVLQPTAIGTSIISSSSNVTFTLSGLTLTGTSSAQAISLTGAGEAVTIEHDIFSNDSVAPSGFGGAISIQIPVVATATQPTVISANTFSDDSASGGGAVTVLASVPLILSGNTFTGDSATGSGGGALFFGTEPGATAPVQITDNTFGGTTTGAGNTATSNDGGAIYLQAAHAQAVTIASNTFEDNKIIGSTEAPGSRQGGAIYMAINFSDTPFTVTQAHNVFLDNSIDATQATPTPALPADGGAEWLLGVDVNSTDDEFVGNRIAVDDGSPPEGGAVGAFAAAANPPAPAEPGVFTGTNDLFVANSVAARGWGGAIYVGGAPVSCNGSCPGSTVTLNDSTLVGNSVDAGTGSEGGAIWGSPNDHLTLRNSIVYGDTPQPELWGFATTSPVIAYSDACNETGGTAVPAHDGDICANPLLTASGEETMASPTLDAGSNALVPAGVSTDLAGNPRIRANRVGCDGPEPAIVDMGAYEFTGHGPLPPCPLIPVLLRIAPGHLRDRHGRVSVPIKCVSAVQFCTGTLTLSTRGRHPRTLGKRTFAIGTGKSSSVRVPLSHKVLKKLGKAKSVSVLAQARARDKAGHEGTAKRKLRLRLG